MTRSFTIDNTGGHPHFAQFRPRSTDGDMRIDRTDLEGNRLGATVCAASAPRPAPRAPRGHRRPADGRPRLAFGLHSGTFPDYRAGVFARTV